MVLQDLARAFPDGISHAQRGFVPRRDFSANVLELDTHARLAGMEAAPDRPLLLTTDFASAFPSLSQGWARRALAAAGLPEGMLSFVIYSFQHVVAYTALEGHMQLLFVVLSGVIQGCPLASAVFVIALNPWLLRIQAELEIPKRGIVRACADDLGFVLRAFAHLSLLFAIFTDMAHVANLQLKAVKCVLVPLCEWSPAVKQATATCLANLIPSWKDFAIEPCAKYLGTWLGPLTSGLLYKEPAVRWVTRARQLSEAGAPPLLTVRMYNSRAATMLGYVAQFGLPDAVVLEQERKVLNWQLHLPGNTLSVEAAYSLRFWNGPSFTMLLPLTAATFMRAAFGMQALVSSSLEMLRASLGLPLAALARNARLCSPWWDTTPSRSPSLPSSRASSA